MAEEDIYGNKKRFEALANNLDLLLLTPEERIRAEGKEDRQIGNRGIYYCKNKNNLQYFKKLITSFEAKDESYIRRLSILNHLKLIVHAIDKDLKELDRSDIDKIVAFMHTRKKASKSKSSFIKDIRLIWRILFPELDEKGRPDDTLTPYSVRHLKEKIDKSKEKRRNDRLSFDEFERIIDYFGRDSRLQFFLMLSMESLGRPQEILYTRIKDIEMSDNYAKIWISEHGKEGTGILQVVDSFPYLQKWLREHPFAKNKDSFIFINISKRRAGSQLTPFHINKKLRIACQDLKIDKPITCYSFKRNGVTFRRLRGDSDVEIQHVARWTSTKQLKTYDKSEQEDALKISLVKRGLLKDEHYKQFEPKYKTCFYCGNKEGFASEICGLCKRPLDRKKIEEEYKNRELVDHELVAFLKNDGVKQLFKLFHKIELLEEEIRELRK